jgi:hypothetical protein
MIIINEVGPPVKEKHVCWKVKQDESNHYILEEIVEKYYKHPDAPDDALIMKYDIKIVAKINISSKFFPSLYLLMNAEKNIDLINDLIKNDIND